MSLSAKQIFGSLSADPAFVERLDAGLASIMSDGRLDANDVPEIVFLLIDTYNSASVRVAYDDLPALLGMLFDDLLRRSGVEPDDREKWDRLADTAIRLVMTRPAVRSAVLSCLDRCFQ